MDRTIKFKGINLSGETVYGGAFVDPNNGNAFIIPIMECVMPIKENTLCQFTGYYDANGDEIYENDIVNSSYDNRQWRVMWNNSTMEYYLALYTGNGTEGSINKKFSTPSFVTDINGKPMMMYKEYTIIKD